MEIDYHRGFLVKLNKNDSTAVIIKSLNSNKAIYIPRSVTIESKEYRIIKIEENAFQSSFNPKVITFPRNSEVKCISKNAFCNSGLQTLELPKSIEILEEGWCKSANCLRHLAVPINVKNMSYIQESYLIYHNCQQRNEKQNEKNSENLNETENILIFVRRDIESAVIPSNIKKIGESAFEYCSKLKSVTFEQPMKDSSTSIEEIGNNAFAYCKNLENDIMIPESIQRIGRSAFAYCSKLKSIYIPEQSKLRIISSDAFFHSSINEITIPSEVEYLEEGWCRDTNELTRIKINSNNKHFQYINEQFLVTLCDSQYSDDENSIKNETSEDKSTENYILLFARRDIENAVIPSNIKRIAKCAFYGCTKLKSIIFSSSSVLEEISEEAFSNCLSLEKIESLPASLKIIRRSAFDECKKLSQIEFHPECELEIIERKSFKNTSIHQLFLSQKIMQLEEGWCDSLNILFDLQIDKQNNNLIYVDNKLLVDCKNNKMLFARRDIESVIIPSNIKRIGKSAFSSCKKMKSLEFASDTNNNLEEIGEYAFSKCSLLESIPIFPPSIKRIEEHAFSSCDKLEIISFISSKIEEICDNSFYSCWKLSKILSIPSTIKRIGKCAFRSSRNLKMVTFESSLESSLIEIDDRAFDFCRNCESIIGIPSSIKRIGNSAFENCVSLKEIKFKNTKSIESKNSSILIEEIGNNAFAYCKNLENDIMIPESIQRIGRSAFAYCSKLKSIYIPEQSKLRIISSDAFFHSSINEITIPSEVEYLEEGWCRDTNELTHIKINSNNKHFQYINEQFLVTLCDSQYSDDENSIKNETSEDKSTENYILLFARRDIENAVIPSNIKRISQCAFQSCTKMKSLVFEPSSTVIEDIGDSAFSYCSSIEKVNLITNRIKRIGKFAFFQCKKLKSIIFETSKEVELPEVLEEIDEDAFDFCENIELISSIPASVKIIGSECFRPLKKIHSIEFLSDDITLGDRCFEGCRNLFIASFANSRKVSLGHHAFYEVSPNFVLYINNGSILNSA